MTTQAVGENGGGRPGGGRKRKHSALKTNV